MKKTMHTEGEIRSAAALLGQRGGLSSAEGRMRKMTFEQRSGLGKKAIAKRWERYCDENAQQAGAGANPAGRSAPGRGRATRSGTGADARHAASRRTRKAKAIKGAAR